MYNGYVHEQWETYNAIVLSWLMNTISEELISGVVYAMSAFIVWGDSKKRFDKVYQICFYQLLREINTLSQGTNSIYQYFTKLKIL